MHYAVLLLTLFKTKGDKNPDLSFKHGISSWELKKKIQKTHLMFKKAAIWSETWEELMATGTVPTNRLALCKGRLKSN